MYCVTDVTVVFLQTAAPTLILSIVCSNVFNFKSYKFFHSYLLFTITNFQNNIHGNEINYLYCLAGFTKVVFKTGFD